MSAAGEGPPVAGDAPQDAPRAVPGRRGSGDPLGKRALFWVPADSPVPEGPRARPGRAVPLGKRALYSGASVPASTEQTPAPENPLGDRGSLEVSCSRCRAVTRVGLLDFVIYSLPVGFWLPRGKYDRRLTCPACRQRVWAGVTLHRG